MFFGSNTYARNKFWVSEETLWLDASQKAVNNARPYAKQGVDAEKVVVTPNAIAPEKFSGIKDSGDLRQKYKLEGKQVIGFAGWFDHWDRLDLLMDVFARLKPKYPQLNVLLDFLLYLCCF